MGFDLSGQEGVRKAYRVNNSFNETFWKKRRIVFQNSAGTVNAHNQALQI